MTRPTLALITLFASSSMLFGQAEQYGHKRTNFEVSSRKAFLIHPSKPAADGSRPWVWYAPAIGAHPNASNGWVLKQLLEQGFTVAGIDVGESYGSPDGRKLFTDFYARALNEHKLDPKVNLLAQSRGGLMHYNWAVENPEKVRAIVGIYPVCDLRSYPGLARAAGAYKLTADQLEKQLADHNPVDRLEPLAKAKVPILHIHGDSDKVVPLEPNSKTLADRYAKFGGPIELIVVPGKGHAEIKEFFQDPRLVQFLIDGRLPAKKGAEKSQNDSPARHSICTVSVSFSTQFILSHGDLTWPIETLEPRQKPRR